MSWWRARCWAISVPVRQRFVCNVEGVFGAAVRQVGGGCGVAAAAAAAELRRGAAKETPEAAAAACGVAAAAAAAATKGAQGCGLCQGLLLLLLLVDIQGFHLGLKTTMATWHKESRRAHD